MDIYFGSRHAPQYSIVTLTVRIPTARLSRYDGHPYLKDEEMETQRIGEGACSRWEAKNLEGVPVGRNGEGKEVDFQTKKGMSGLYLFVSMGTLR